MDKKRIIILVIIAALIVVPGLFFLSVYSGAFGHLQNRKELLNYKNATASRVISAEGDLIGKFFSENRTNITYEQIPSYLIDALIATEDARFYQHSGIDMRSLARVFVKSIFLRDRGSGGGSTITQQLAKNMFGRKSAGIISLPVNKAKEIILARRLERAFSKEEILTLYLNTVSFGENIYGIESAAARFFNRNIGQLTIEESAVLIGMLKATTYYNPRFNPDNALGRRNVVLGQMVKYEYLDPHVGDSLRGLPLKTDYSNIESAGPADYFLVQVKNEARRILNGITSVTGKEWDIEKDGLIISTTLNLTLQKSANKAFRDHLTIMQRRLSEQYRTPAGNRTLTEITERILSENRLTTRADEKRLRTLFGWNGMHTDSLSVRDSIRHALTLLHAGLLAMDPETGALLAWAGGIDFRTQPYDQIVARRQLASVFKPVLYAAALEEGMEPCHYLDNDSIVLSGFDDWSPENFDHSYGGKYSLAGALSKSMNVPTFSLFLEIGYDRVDTLWKKMGFSFPLNNTPALALGTAEASIREIAVAYSTFANGGFLVSPFCITSITASNGELIYENDFNEPGSGIISERSALLMNAILQKAIREGTGVSLNSVYGVTVPLAGKTGTSQNYSDAWFAAYNPKMTIVSRVGASSPLIHFNSGAYGSGSALALPLVALTIKQVQSDPAIISKHIAPFPELPPELSGALDCPDFREDSFFDRIMDVIRRERTIDTDRARKEDQRIRNIIQRILRRRN